MCKKVIDEYKDFSSKGVDDDDFSNYGGLINKIADVFGTSIYAARKRTIIQLKKELKMVLIFMNSHVIIDLEDIGKAVITWLKEKDFP